MNKAKNEAIIKFLLLSAIGVFIFFVNIKIGEKNTVTLIHIIDNIKTFVGRPNLQVVTMIISIFVFVTSLLCRFTNIMPKFLVNSHKKDNWFSYFSYLTASIFSVMVVTQKGFEQVLNPVVGTSSVNIAGDVLCATLTAGVLVVFLVEFGFLEFLGKLLEPIMRRVFKLPGNSAVDALASFVASPSVGVMITNSLYKNDVYTAREACAITTSFSFCSIGTYVFLSSMVGVSQYFPQIVLTSLILSFLVAAITVRIPPLSKKQDVYYSGRVQSEEERKPQNYTKDTFNQAFNAAIAKSEVTPLSIFFENLKNASLFACKVITYVISLSVICLIIANYTGITKIIGAPIVPILNLLKLPDADLIATSSVIGLLALSLPSTLLKDSGVAAISGFFIVVLSTSQVIFFTESANAMLESEMPLSFLDLIAEFFIRTIILFPLVAFAAHLVFGF